MASSASGNVLALGNGPRARAPLTRQESAELLAGCRELALTRMSAALATMLDRVEEDLFELAESSVLREARDACLQARALARSKRGEMEATFRRHFIEVFNRKLSTTPAPSTSGDVALALVDHQELEQALAEREMARKLAAGCEDELFALSARMGFLLERPGLAHDANPVSPANLCAALRAACEQVEAGFQVRMTLLRQLERHAVVEMRRVYHDLNAHLVQERILPDVKFEARRLPAAPRALRPGPQPTPPEDAFSALADLLMRGAAPEAFAPAAAGSFAPGAGSATTSPAVPQSFVESLTRRHRAGVAMPTAGVAPVNVVRAIRAEAGTQSLAAVDALTIDLVSMLFDFVFEDVSIPAAVKALLARLQIPMLKAALIDRGFFSTCSHPARRLLDALADSALGLDEDDTRGVETLSMIDGVVDRVLERFDSDLALFEELATEARSFLAARERLDDDIVRRSAQLVQARERREIAEAVASSEVNRRIGARRFVPPPVRDMLQEEWSRALALVVLAEGEGSPLWQRLTMAMEDLLWSVEPKGLPEDRKRLLAMLPAMLGELQLGLQRAGAGDERRDAFMGALVDCHAMAVKAGLRGMAAMPPATRAPVVVAPGIEREIIPAGEVQVEEIRLRSAPGSAVRNLFTRTGIFTNVQRGSWVEFRRDGSHALRARLTWVSPDRGVYLFTNPLCSTAAVSISPEALAEQMRLGDARLMDAAPLTERAVDSMLASLRDKTAAARSPSA